MGILDLFRKKPLDLKLDRLEPKETKDIKVLLLTTLTAYTPEATETPLQPEEGLATLLDAYHKHKPDILLAPEWYNHRTERINTREDFDSFNNAIISEVEPSSLVIPGTALWLDEVEEGGDTMRYLRNTASIITGGKVLKEYDKYIDIGKADTSVRRLASEEAIALQLDCEFKTGKEKGCVFQWNNYNVGLEICFDNKYHCLKESGHEDIDLQIVLACGMNSFFLNSLAVRYKGYALLCDGRDLAGSVQLMDIMGPRRMVGTTDYFIPADIHTISL